MPPDRGSVKKITSVKKDNKTSTTRNDDKEAVKSHRSKTEKRDDSLSRNKEKKPKDDKQKIVSTTSTTKGKEQSKHRIDTEKMRAIRKDVANDRNKVKESLSKNRTTTESRSSTKSSVVGSGQPKANTSKTGGTSVRSQLSYRTSVTRATTEKAPDVPGKKVKAQTTPSRREAAIKKKPQPEESRQARPTDVRQQKPKRDRTRTRTLSPHEVKIVRAPPEVVEMKHKPSDHGDDPTDVFGSLGNSDVPLDSSMVDEEYDYEDDFEDYESDFEEDIDSETDVDTDSDVPEETPRPAVEEEKKLDSGNYDLTESKRKDQQEMREIREALERENSALAARERIKEQQLLPADEGFVEPGPATFIDFTSAKKRMQERKSTARVKRRGEQLLDMIRLDVVSFSLLELAPMPYELFMKSYGRSNTTQVHVQTNEDNLSEEIQTDEIVTSNKWTQKPVTFLSKLENEQEDRDAWKQHLSKNSRRLNQFLTTVCPVVLRLLELKGNAARSTTDSGHPLPVFSEGRVSLPVDLVPFLSGRPVTLLRFFPHCASTLLTVHAASPSNADVLLGRCMMCVWSLLVPSSPPRVVLMSSQEVTAVCFEPSGGRLVFAGLRDGSVCVWDLQESGSNHLLVEDWILRSPTYSTAEILKDQGHLTEVVALQPLMEPVGDVQFQEASPVQVCSLEEGGVLIVWTVLQSCNLVEQDLGLAHWGRVRLVCTTVIKLHSDVLYTDLVVDKAEPSHLYVATSAGMVLHCLKDGGKPRPRLYVADSVNCADAGCLESCPFGQGFFLVGSGDGSLRLHSRWSDKPMANLGGSGCGEAAIRRIQWSASRAGLFFVLDSSSRVHVWDLGESDIHPVQSESLKKDVTDMSLSTEHHLALSTSCGRVEVHTLKPSLCPQTPEESRRELEKVLLYTSLL